jgi:hypothetical protein
MAHEGQSLQANTYDTWVPVIEVTLEFFLC